MTSSWQWVLLADDLPGADQLKNVNWLLYGGIAGVVLVLIVIGLLMRKRKRPVDPEQGLSENLAGFPPAPGKPGRRRLTVHGQPMRVRLVVVAPTGKKPVSVEDAEALVGSMMQGMGEILKADRPRIKVWPVQYSNIGFAQSFFRRILARNHAAACPTGYASPARPNPARRRSCSVWPCWRTNKRTSTKSPWKLPNGSMWYES